MAAAGGVAYAHANYVSSNPGSDARLIRPPTEVRIVFSESPDPKGSAIQVLDVTGSRLDNNDAAPSGDPNGLRVTLKPFGEGGYTVAWTAVSAVDGHETKGSFAFAVGNAPLPKIPDVGAQPPPSAGEIAGRAISYAGIAITLGAGLFGLLVHAAESADERRRERALVLAGGTLLVIGGGLLIVDQGDRLPVRLGALLDVRVLAGLAAIVATQMRLGRHVVAAAGGSAALTATLVSHAAAYADPRDMFLDLSHIVFVSAWTGGAVALLVIVLRGGRPSTDAGARALGATVGRFSLLAMTSVSVIVLTGTLQSLDRLVLLQDLVETPYGIALLGKIVLLGVALSLGALNLFRWGPRLRAAADVARAHRRLMLGTIGETALFALIVGAAGLLTAFAPPAQRTGADYDSTQHAGDLRLELLVPTTTPGRNRYVLRVRQGLMPVTGAEKVAYRFTMIEHDMGESEIVATERAPGEYVAEGSPTSMFGTWRIETIVRLTGRDDVRAVFQVPIGAPSGAGGAAAKAVIVGQYTAVIFIDPTTPVAGAPIAVTVVVVDRKGDPVPGLPVKLSFDGPAPLSPLDAPQASVGRYTATIPALEAGAWKMTVTIGTGGASASTVYGFDVAR